MTNPVGYQIVEHACSHPTCRDKGTYDLLATCGTCGEKHIARCARGHEPFIKACPRCGNYNIRYGTAQEAEEFKHPVYRLAKDDENWVPAMSPVDLQKMIEDAVEKAMVRALANRDRASDPSIVSEKPL